MNEFDKKIQELDEQLAKLKALDIKEISQTTRLTTNKIQDILEKRFDNIDRMRAKGFLAILEREYKMDLSMWLEEYTRYFVGGVSAPSNNNATPEVAELKIKNVDSESSKKAQQEPEIKGNDKLDSQKSDSQKDSGKLDSQNATSPASEQAQQAKEAQPAENAQPSNLQPSKESAAPKSVQSLKLPKEGQKQNSEFKKDDGKSAQNILIYIVLIAVTAAIVAYFGVRMFGGSAKNVAKQNVPATAQTAQSSAQTPVIVEQKVDDGAYDGIFIDADSVNGAVSIMSVINSKEAIDKDGEASGDSASLDSQNADSHLNSKSANSENVAQNAVARQGENVAQNVDSQNVARNESIFPQNNVAPQKFIVTPNSELWVGVIDVQTQRSTQRNIRTTAEFELDKPQIFVFGHGDFKASVDGDPAPHKSKQFVRFYFDGQKIEEINYTRYKQLFPNERW